MGNLDDIRTGAPYSDPTFKALCRAHDIWGTEEATLCAAFWETAKRQQQTLSTHESLAQRPREHAASAKPSGYAYRYPDGIRFNDGREVNGCKPTEALPYWFGAAPVAQEPVADDTATLAAICDLFGIGSAARDPGTILANVGNVVRRSACLRAIERHLTVSTPPDLDEGDDEPGEECLLRWGADSKGYAEHFLSALKEFGYSLVAAHVAQEPVARDWPSIQSAIDEYLDGYELIGEPGDHTPTEFEKFLLTDAIAGLLDDEKFLGLFAAPVAAQVPTIKEALKVVQAQHPDDAAVDQFAVAMKTKLAQKRAEGRGGWEDKAQCSQDRLSLMLRGHVAKGDPVDVANFAMMLHQRGERISGRDAASPSVQDLEDAGIAAAFEAVRKRLCRLPRYSFMILNGGVRRVHDSSGNWLEFDQVHALFDPVSVDAAIAAKEANHD